MYEALKYWGTQVWPIPEKINLIIWGFEDGVKGRVSQYQYVFSRDKDDQKNGIGCEAKEFFEYNNKYLKLGRVTSQDFACLLCV